MNSGPQIPGSLCYDLQTRLNGEPYRQKSDTIPGISIRISEKDNQNNEWEPSNLQVYQYII